MTVQEWQALVKEIIRENPEWLAATQVALQQGVEARLHDEMLARANAETALIICFDGKPQIQERHIELVKQAIKNSKLVGGTEYANKL